MKDSDLAVAETKNVQALPSAEFKSCTCRVDLEMSLTERFIAHKPEGSDHAIELQGYGFAIVGDQMISAPFMEYKATAKFPVKKTGATKEKTIRGNMMFSYCPFCGEKARP